MTYQNQAMPIEGDRRIAADFVPFVPDNIKVDEDHVLFTSKYRRYKVWVRARRLELRNGIQVITDEGHVIEFKDGFYLADNTRKIMTIYGEKTEAEFLRGMVKERETIGTAHPVYEGNPFEPKPITEDADKMDLFSMFDAQTIEALRGLFTAEEVEEHKLERATKDRLVTTALRLHKSVPEDWVVIAGSV